MISLIIALHMLVCLFIVIVILLQAGKGADAGVSFGGGSQTVFGPRGAATFLSKLTMITAAIFLITSLYLAYYYKQGTPSVVDRLNTNSVNETQPATETKKATETQKSETQKATNPAESRPGLGQGAPKSIPLEKKKRSNHP